MLGTAVRWRSQRTHSHLLLLITCLTASNITITGLYIHMTNTDPQTHVASMGESLTMECNFHADDYNLFECPIVWTKRQLDEEVNINLMSNINQPFLHTNRFEVLLRSETPRYYFSLHIQNISRADSGNYTCQIRGQNYVVLAESFHRVFVKSPFEALHLHSDKSLPLTIQSDYEERLINEQLHSTPTTTTTTTIATHQQHHSDPPIFRFVENRPGRMGCFTLGGYYPVPSLKITLDQRDITDYFVSHVASFLSGKTRGLKILGSKTQLWSENFTLSADHDQARLVCAAIVENFQVEKVEALVDVVYQPKIRCKPTSAFLSDKNVFIDCRVKSKPQYFHYYWLLNYSTPSTKSPPSPPLSSSSPSSSRPSLSSSSSSSFHPSSSTPTTFTLTSGSQYDGLWTEVKDRIDGISEIQLYFSEATQDRFKEYTIVVENIVGCSTKKIPLLQKQRKVQTEILSDASVNNADSNQTSQGASTSPNAGRKSHDRKKASSITPTNSGAVFCSFHFHRSFLFTLVVVVVFNFNFKFTTSIMIFNCFQSAV